jgi:hypothetical protein
LAYPLLMRCPTVPIIMQSIANTIGRHHKGLVNMNLPAHNTSCDMWEDVSCIGILPICGMSSHIWKVFSCMVRLPIYGKSSRTREVAPCVGRLPIYRKSLHTLEADFSNFKLKIGHSKLFETDKVSYRMTCGTFYGLMPAWWICNHVGQHYLNGNNYTLIANAIRGDDVELCDVAIGIQALSVQRCSEMHRSGLNSTISFHLGVTLSLI